VPGDKSASPTPGKSRRTKMLDAGIFPDMPDLPYGQYLIDHLFEVGPTLSSGVGPSPLSFSEIESWQRQMCIELHPWELRLLRRLSAEYCAESQAATKQGAPAPFQSIAVLRLHQREQDAAEDAFFA
jgi:hypothetical protein